MWTAPRPLLVLVLVLGVGTARAEDASRPADALAAARAATQAGARALATGESAAAVQAFERALALAPRSVHAARNLALALAHHAVEALGRRDGAAALDLLDRALDLHPGRLAYAVLRGRALLQAGRTGEALRAAQESVARSPEHAVAWQLLADVQERAGDLAGARAALERALVLSPADVRLRERWTELDRREATEGRFLTHGTGNFEVRYSPDADPGTVRLALTLLEDAYARVTADLGLAPRTAARVVLYDGDDFERVTGAQPWIGALYANGTLRVPLRNLERRQAAAARVLAHEFTHHVLRERTPSLPTWWHEGIAQVEEDGTANAAARRARADATVAAAAARDGLLSLERLRSLGIAEVADPVLVTLFYAQAYSFVAWLGDRSGPGALTAFLVALGTSKDVDAAASSAFGADVTELLARWRADR